MSADRGYADIVTIWSDRQLTEWAAGYNVAASQMRFLTAFASRNAPPARKRLKDLVSDTYSWYADEPGQELYFGPLRQGRGATLAVVTPNKAQY